mgnify:CR=1 FL=1
MEFKRKHGTDAYNRYLKILVEREKQANKSGNTKEKTAAMTTKEKTPKGLVYDFGYNADYFTKHIAPVNTIYKRPYCDGFTIPSSTRIGTVPASVGISAHLPRATSHRNTKPDLTAMDLKFFHRPRLPIYTDLYTKNCMLTMPVTHMSMNKKITGGATVSGCTGTGTGTPATPNPSGSNVYTTIDKNDISLITGVYNIYNIYNI